MSNNSLIGLLRKFLVKAETLEKSQGETESLRNLLRANSKSTAEYFQDVWAATAIGRDGYFVEFGAADGKTISNTYLLEKEFGWTGILAEPCRAFHSQLSYNRECIIDHRAVWTVTGETRMFSESQDAFLSGISSTEYLNETVPSIEKYPVKTVSLTDLLSDYDAPEIIDFLSIDTEGGEAEILKSFINKGKYTVRLICVEHSWRKDDEHLLNWMEKKGFSRVFEYLPSRDYWFVNND